LTADLDSVATGSTAQAEVVSLFTDAATDRAGQVIS